jgi:transposase-like protein
VLGLQQGATENGAAVEDLLGQLVACGVDPKAKRLFVIDGAKALRAAINKVFGSQHPVQRCRNHKIRNVCDRLPEEQREQIVRIRIEAVSSDSTTVKVHPDGMGALKKTAPRLSANRAGDGPPRFIWLPQMLERL